LAIKIADADGVEVPGAFFAGAPSILRDGYVWRVQVDGRVTGGGSAGDLADEYGYPFFTDQACTTPLPETPVTDEAAFEETGISNLAVEYKGKFFAPGAVMNKDVYWKPGLPGTCQAFTNEVRELGAELQKPADFVGPIGVVAR
jgi:hypothetical protein